MNSNPVEKQSSNNSFLESLKIEGLVNKISEIKADVIANSWWESIQEWNSTGEFDAPSITKDGKCLFYTVYDEEGTQVQDAIGISQNLGTIKNPSWSDDGIVIQSFGEGSNTPRAMDPAIFQDGDASYLIFGSHDGGIVLTEIDPTTKTLKDYPHIKNSNDLKSRFIKIANNYKADSDNEVELTGIEAPYLHKKGDYYYLFVNWGSCCSGVNSTYSVRVGRSELINGPYLDKSGKSMINYGGSEFLPNTDKYIGSGHVGITDISTLKGLKLESDYLVSFHYYDSLNNGNSKLAARLLTWEDGWPKVGRVVIDTPSIQSLNSKTIEIAHDPSHLILENNKLYAFGSGTGSSALLGYEINFTRTFDSKFSDHRFFNKGDSKYEIETTDGIDELTGIQTLKFQNKAIQVANDIKGTFDQVTGLNTDSGKMFRLYNAAFARFPDADGLKYWIDEFSSGRNTRRVVAQSFLGSAEFTEKYGSNVSDETYVNNLYKNVLGRDADNEGLNYWVGNLSSGLETRYETLLGFAESVENKALFTEMTGFG